MGWGGGNRKRNMLGVDHCQEEKQQCKKTISEGVRHYDTGVSEVSRGLHGMWEQVPGEEPVCWRNTGAAAGGAGVVSEGSGESRV